MSIFKKVLTANLIREGLKHAISLEQHFRAHDPDIDRMLQFQHKLKSCVGTYQALSKQLEKQKKNYFNRFYNNKKMIIRTNTLDISSDASVIFKSVHN